MEKATDASECLSMTLLTHHARNYTYY